MKLSNKISVICIALTIVLSGLVYLQVAAKEPGANTQQIKQIQDGCLSLKNTLNQLHVSDALLRVNMGQRYELVSTKLIDRFNSRVASNGFNVDNFNVVSVNYKLALDSFRLSYKSYEEALTVAIKIDCSIQPSEFYDALLLARDDRAKLYATVQELNKQVDQYQSAVGQFEKDFQSGKVK